MAEATSTTTNQQYVKQAQGPVAWTLSLIGKLIAVIITSLFLSLVIEWIGIAFFWPEEGANHSYQMLQTEKGYLSIDFTKSLLFSNPVQFSQHIFETIYDWVFVKTGALNWMSNAKANPKAHWSYQIYWAISTYIEASIYIILVFVIRLLILVLTSPVFVLTGIVGLVDGLVRRDVRRLGAGYESGFVYHHSKRSIKPIVVFAWFAYLSTPFSVHPNWILIPAACLTGIAISITAGAFKKYL